MKSKLTLLETDKFENLLALILGGRGETSNTDYDLFDVGDSCRH